MAELQAQHARLVAGRWQSLTLAEQLGNIGSEVGRALRAKAGGNQDRLQAALTRALELFDLTVAGTERAARREVLRAREVVCDYLAGDNDFDSTPDSLEAYFTPFALVARQSA